MSGVPDSFLAGAAVSVGELGRPALGAPTAAAGDGFPFGIVFIALILVVLAGTFVTNKYRRLQDRRRELERVRYVADEDVTRLGEDIALLDLDTAGTDEATRTDYQRATDSYDLAKRRLDTAKEPEDLRTVSTALEDGRFQMTCVRARLDGRPLPERRAPCFFNPQHGPSVKDVDWTPPHGTTRPVPVCTADAARLAQGEEPDAREVLVAGRRRPYWEGGSAYGPWFRGYYGGYYGGTDMMGGLLLGTMLGSALTHDHLGGLHGAGAEGGFDGGGGGGFDGGGFGGFDGGGAGGGF